MRAVLLLLLVVGFAPNLLPLRDPDFFWHLKTGEWIWQHRSLPDEFLFAAAPQGTPAATQHFTMTSYWLSQVIFHLVHAAGGMAAIVVARISLVGLLVFLLVRRASRDGLLLLGLLVLAVAALATFPAERPQYISFVFAALLMRLLEGFRDSGTTAALRWQSAAIPLLLLVWANCHGGYVVGLGFIALTAIAESLKQFHPRLNPLPPGRWHLLLCSGAAGFLASFLNPNGGYVFRIAALPVWLRSFVTEYLSTIEIYRLHGDPAYIAYWMLLALTAAGIAASWRSPDLTAIALTAVTGYLSFTQSRFVPFFVIVSLPVVSRALSTPRTVRAARGLVFAVAAGVSAWMLKHYGPNLLETGRVGQVDQNLFPVAAADFIERAGLRENIFCHFNWGGYLLWRLAPAKVFIDGRNGDRDLLWAYRTILSGVAGAGVKSRAAWFGGAGIRLVVVDFYEPSTGEVRGLVNDLLADPSWAPVFSSRGIVVFARASTENRETLKHVAIPKQDFAAGLLAYCSQLVAAKPDHVPPYVARGDLLARYGGREEALRSYLEALRIQPGNRSALIGIRKLQTP